MKWPAFRSRAQSQEGWLLTGFSSVIQGTENCNSGMLEKPGKKTALNHSPAWIYMTVQDLTTERKASRRYQSMQWFPLPTRHVALPSPHFKFFAYPGAQEQKL